MRKAAVNTKKELNSLLVAERKSMREKQKQSAFMRRSLSVYSAMKKRAKEAGVVLDFTLDNLRAEWSFIIGYKCPYCLEAVLSAANITPDHYNPIARGGSFDQSNIKHCCKSCNWQKGQLTGSEFESLLAAIKAFPSMAQADIKRRLTIGGKWGVRA